MKWDVLKHGHEAELLRVAAELYDLNINNITALKTNSGYFNLIYDCLHRGQPSILRISFCCDRTLSLIRAELHFIDYLAAHGMHVSIPFVSKNHNYVEMVLINEQPVYMVCFEKAQGVPVRQDKPASPENILDEKYYRIWGKAMGQMHALSKYYQPISDAESRPDWFTLNVESLDIDNLIPFELSQLSDMIYEILDQVSKLPKDKDSYGMIHGNLKEKKFTVNLLHDEITVFDFDESCYFWFVFEIAIAWEEIINRAVYQQFGDREIYLKKYMQAFLDGYSEENELPNKWFEKIPLFVKLSQSKNLLDCLKIKFDEETGLSDPMRNLTECIEDDLPHMNFFEEFY
ncbi:phosphotransferase [bacterium]|nr:phosphotransferase [bacterium]